MSDKHNKTGLLELTQIQVRNPKFGRKKVTAQQNFGEYKRMIGKVAAFREWQLKLNHKDRLPRGKFFKGKEAGKPFLILDEFWSVMSREF